MNEQLKRSRHINSIRKSSFLVFLMTLCLCASAQTQHGVVKTKGRLGTNGNVIPGMRLSGATVTVKGRSNKVVSDNNGTFSFKIPAQKYYLQSVRKQGYALVDLDMLSREYAYSANPLTLVMEDPEKQKKELKEITDKLNKTLKEQRTKLEDEIIRLKEENKISQKEYEERMQSLLSANVKNISLVSEMAARYSKIDYDQIDEFERCVNELILNGELDKADSLITTKGDLTTQVEENLKSEEAIKDEEDKLEKAKAVNKFDKEELAKRCYSRYEIFKLQNLNDSAAYYLELRTRLDSTNVDWLLATGYFIDKYLAEYDRALMYYKKALHYAILQYGEMDINVSACYYNMSEAYSALCDSVNASECYIKSMESSPYFRDYKEVDLAETYFLRKDYPNALMYYKKAVKSITEKEGENEYSDYLVLCYNRIAGIYLLQGDYPNALEYCNKTLKIQIGFFSETYSDVASTYYSIGYVYYSQGDYSEALKYYGKATKVALEYFGDTPHPDIADYYDSSALIYDLQGRYDKALEYYQKAMNVLIKFHGEKHAEVIDYYNKMGDVCYSHGDYVHALEYYNKALEIRLPILGEDHPDVIAIKENIEKVKSKIAE